MCLQNYILLISIHPGRAYLKTQTTIYVTLRAAKQGAAFPIQGIPKRDPRCATQVAAALNQGNLY